MSRTSYQFVPLMYELKIDLIRSKQKAVFTYLNHENSRYIVLELELLHPQRKRRRLTPTKRTASFSKESSISSISIQG